MRLPKAINHTYLGYSTLLKLKKRCFQCKRCRKATSLAQKLPNL